MKSVKVKIPFTVGQQATNKLAINSESFWIESSTAMEDNSSGFGFLLRFSRFFSIVTNGLAENKNLERLTTWIIERTN